MKVRDLIYELEQFDKDMEVRIGMVQNYGGNTAMNISDDVAEHTVNTFRGKDYKAVIITGVNRVGTVNYGDDKYEE